MQMAIYFRDLNPELALSLHWELRLHGDHSNGQRWWRISHKLL